MRHPRPGGALLGGGRLARGGSNPFPSARISPDIAAPLPLFSERPRETVWKIRMGFTLGSHEALKRGEKPLYCHFCATKNTRFRPLQLFSKQFQKGHSRKPSFRCTGFSEIQLCPV